MLRYSSYVIYYNFVVYDLKLTLTMSIEKTRRIWWLHYKNHYGSYKVPNKLPIEDIQNVSCR